MHAVLLGRPQSTIRQYEAQWRQLLADVHARPLPTCPSETFQLPAGGGEEEGGSLRSAGSVAESGTTPPSSSNTTPLLLSIVITHHNRHRLLQQAIESIERQTYGNFEVILVDDGSTDPEALNYLSELAWKWWTERAWKVLREPNRYLGAARNTGARVARGKYVLFMDDDDVAKPEQVETMLRVAELSGADVVTTGHDLLRGRSPPRGRSAARYIPLGGAMNAGVLRNVFGDANMLVHRQFFLDMGGFTEEYGVGFEDYEFLAKTVARDNHVEALAEPMHWYRQHAGTMSVVTDVKAGQLRYLRAFLEVFPFLPRMTQSLLRYVQSLYFYVDPQGGPMQKYAYANTSTTTTTTTTTSTSTTSTSTSTSTTPTSKSTTISTTESTTPLTVSTFTTVPSSQFTTITTVITTAGSTQTFITSLVTPGTTCPCRSHRKPRLSSFSSSRSTCTSTQTIRPTIKRTARATTVTVTYTPTVTFNEEKGRLVSLPSPRYLAFGMDGARLFMELDDPTPMATQTHTLFTDAPPARAPMAVAAEYSAGGEYVMVTFDRPVNVEVGRRFRCDAFLEVAPREVPNGAFLGTKPEDCRLYFASPTELRVTTDPRLARRDRNALAPGKLLVFREGVLSNLDSLNRAFVSGSIEVAPPLDPDPPTVIVDAPSVIGWCDEYLRIDLSRSTGSVGRPFLDAHFDFNSTASDNHHMDAPLRQFLHAAALDMIKGGRLVVDVPATLLTEFTAYTFQMSLWNVFGVGATGYATASRVASNTVPAVQIEGPLRVRQNQAVSFAALIPHEVCGRPFNHTLSWSLISGPSKVRVRGHTRNAVIFPVDTFVPGDYVLGLRVVVWVEQEEHDDIKYNPASGATYTFSHAFTVIPADLRIEIVGGSRLIGYEDNAWLTTRIHGPATTEEFDFVWNCYGMDRESPCELADGGEWNATVMATGAVPGTLAIEGRQWRRDQDVEFVVRATHRQYGYVLSDLVVLAIAGTPNVPRVELAIERYSVTTYDQPLRMTAKVMSPERGGRSRGGGTKQFILLGIPALLQSRILRSGSRLWSAAGGGARVEECNEG